jgi:hypothetical protein
MVRRYAASAYRFADIPAPGYGVGSPKLLRRAEFAQDNAKLETHKASHSAEILASSHHRARALAHSPGRVRRKR